MTSHIFQIDDEMAKQRLIRQLQNSPVRDDKGRRLMVTVVRYKPKSAPLRQKGLWYAWLEIMAAHTGCTPREMKDAVKDELLPMVEVVNRLTGEIRVERQHTESLTDTEWNVLLTRTEVLAKQHLDITLPPSTDPQAWLALQHHKRGAAA